jgi:hypothetical protein
MPKYEPAGPEKVELSEKGFKRYCLERAMDLNDIYGAQVRKVIEDAREIEAYLRGTDANM